MKGRYVHGYGSREDLRLQDQASTLVELLHSDTRYPAGSRVLEAGCGVGAQTTTLARGSPGARVTSMDISASSLTAARRRASSAGLANVSFLQADIMELPFGASSFDHVFACFVLEHLPHPLEALVKLLGVLVPGGTVTVIEGDHGSAFFHPDSEAARRAIQCQVELQRRAGGDANIGRRLFPLLQRAGCTGVRASPRLVYADASRPELVDGFTRKTFAPMVEGVRRPALDAGLAESRDFDQGIADLYRTTEDDGTFCYTFFKAFGFKPRVGGEKGGEPPAAGRRRETVRGSGAEDLARKVASLSPECADEVLRMLADYGREEHEREAARVRLAILKLSRGIPEKVAYYVRVAKEDFRDVLAMAEYPEQLRARAWKAGREEEEERRRRDLEQYEEWLRE